MNPLAPISALTPISLEELNADAALQTRVDRKYILPAAALPSILASLPARGARVLEVDGERALRYASTYFDTPQLDSYLGAARGRRRRFKVRARTYVDSGDSFLEVKTRGGRSTTVKERVRVDNATLGGGTLDIDAMDYARTLLADADIGSADRLAETLVPILETHYRRVTLLVPEENEAPSRATIDVDLTWNDLTRGGFTLPASVIVETKSSQRPSSIDRLLWRHGHRPATISKYATGLAASRPELPHTKWHRVLTHHFGGAVPTPTSHSPAPTRALNAA